ncbi:MAG: trigger factor [Promicromonosporaceae bacterium]|nr:trigger factor [Promicromonosporaceae bacterium]
MKSTVETLDPTKVKLTVEVEYDEIKPAVEAAYKQIASQVNIPGFRKGKVPARIIDQRVGWGAVVEQAINSQLGKWYQEAAQEAKLRPMGQPEVDVVEIPEAAGSGVVKFTADVEVRPVIDLPELSTLDISVEPAAVKDEDIEERLDLERERFSTLIGVDRPAQDGDFVVIDLVAKVGDEEVDSVSGISYQIGAGNMLDGLDEALIGLSADEPTTFKTELAGGEHAGAKANVTVTPSAVKERELPAADDDFAQMVSEFETLAEYQDSLREEIAKAKRGNQAVAAREAIIEALEAAVEVPVPPALLAAQLEAHLRRENLTSEDDHAKEAAEEEERALRRGIIMDTLAEQLDVKVAQGELVDFMVSTARQYGMEPQEFISMVDSNGQIPSMVAELARQKSLAMALRQVVVKDTAGQVIDLTEFIGSDENDEAQRAVAEAAAEALAADADDK